MKAALATKRYLYILLGFLSIFLGILGFLLPVLPGTVFIIAAGYFFARSSPSLDNWLRTHKRFGPIIDKWEKTGAIPLKAKIVAVTSMVISVCGVFITSTNIYLKVVTLVVVFFSAAYVITRPNS